MACSSPLSLARRYPSASSAPARRCILPVSARAYARDHAARVVERTHERLGAVLAPARRRSGAPAAGSAYAGPAHIFGARCGSAHHLPTTGTRARNIPCQPRGLPSRPRGGADRYRRRGCSTWEGTSCLDSSSFRS
jgi:hypothetical protein